MISLEYIINEGIMGVDIKDVHGLHDSLTLVMLEVMFPVFVILIYGVIALVYGNNYWGCLRKLDIYNHTYF